uniref:RanBP2-type domain-containing protein n=1 Tax=Toxoplasma gondii COUG TaxID=1074873 RepID=A0A2G8XN76_TOXGO|nr:hypothetical protein TGCOUG_238510 [Toxoplasma gondii COUG]
MMSRSSRSGTSSSRGGTEASYSGREGWSERRRSRERESASSSSSRRDRGGDTRSSGGSANEKSESYSSSRKRMSSSSSSSVSYPCSHSSDRSSRRHDSERGASGDKAARLSSSPSAHRPSSPRHRASSSSSSRTSSSSSSSAWPSTRDASVSWSRGSKQGYGSSSRRDKSRSPSRRDREGSRERRYDRRQGSSSRVYGRGSRSGSREGGRRSTSAISDSREKDPLSNPAGASDSEQEAGRRRKASDEILYSSIAVLENIPENCTEEDVEERVRSVSISKGFSVPNGVTFAQMTPQDLRVQLGKALQAPETPEVPSVMTVAYVDFPSVDAAAKFRRSCRTGSLFLFNRHCTVHHLPDRTAALEADANLSQPARVGKSAAGGTGPLRSDSWACFRCNVYNVGSRAACGNCGGVPEADPSQAAATGDTRGRGARGSGAKGAAEAGVGGWGFDPVENPSAWMVVMDVLGLEVEDFLKAFRRASRKFQVTGETDSGKKSADQSKGDGAGSGSSGRLEIQKCVYVEDTAKEGGGRPNHFLLLRFSSSEASIEGWKCVKSLVGKEVASQLCGARAQVLTRKEKQSMQEMLKIVEKTGSRDDSKDISVLRIKLEDMQDIAKSSSVYEQLLQQWQGLLLPLATNQPPLLTSLDEKSGYYYDASIDLYLDPTTNYYMTSVGDYYIHDSSVSALRRVCSYADQQKLLEQGSEGGRAKMDGATGDNGGEATGQEGGRGSGSHGPSNSTDTVASLLAAAQKTAKAAKDALERAKEQRGLDEEQKRQRRLQELQKLEDQHRQNMKQKQLQKQAGCDAIYDEAQAGYGHDPNIFTQNGYSAGSGGAYGARQMGDGGPEAEMSQNFSGRFPGSVAPSGYGFPSGGAGASGVSPSPTSGVSGGPMGFTPPPPPPPPGGRGEGVPGKEGQQFFLPHQYGGENAHGAGRGRGGRGGGFGGHERVFEDSRSGLLGVSGIFETGGPTEEDEDESLSRPGGQGAEDRGTRDARKEDRRAGFSGEKVTKEDARDDRVKSEDDQEKEAFCFLCLRKFVSKDSLLEHETKSKLHAWFVSEQKKSQHQREEKRKKEIELMQLLQLQLA